MDRAPYLNREEAGCALAAELARVLAREPARGAPLVLGLPRGGVPVALEVARKLRAPLDVLIVRKLGLPGQEELAMGAIASGGVRVLNRDVLDLLHVSQATVDQVAEEELRELERREAAYRGDRPRPELAGRCVILVDDGLATGATMRAAVDAVRRAEPAEVVVAVPVAPRETVVGLRRSADRVICPWTPEPFFGIGGWYVDFAQTSDAEVRAILDRAGDRIQLPPAGGSARRLPG